jgi:hypothetical protein
MATRKGVGGPKTAAGKAKSSINAIKFGVSTYRSVDDEERELISRLTKELLDFYQPQSPLEIMQLERIALCRAKLARLYEVERTRLQLARQTIDASPKKLLEQLGFKSDLSQKLALEQIEYQSMSLPLQLTLETLKAIVNEVQHYGPRAISEKEFKRYLPSLYQYLNQNQFLGIDEEDSILNKLQLVLQKLKKIVESENPMIGKMAHLLGLIIDKNHQAQVEEDDDDVHELLLQLDPQYKAPDPKARSNSTEVDVHEILNHLNLFGELLSACRRAEKIVTHYEKSKALIVKSLVLPQTEADLLLRYQTTWERRLSTEVGEFIELRKYSGK